MSRSSGQGFYMGNSCRIIDLRVFRRKPYERPYFYLVLESTKGPGGGCQFETSRLTCLNLGLRILNPSSLEIKRKIRGIWKKAKPSVRYRISLEINRIKNENTWY